MSYMFYNCSSLTSLPDISKWDTSSVDNMSYMLYNRSSLPSLPDISKWDIINVIHMDYMFFNCNSLVYLPDIFRLNIFENKYIIIYLKLGKYIKEWQSSNILW